MENMIRLNYFLKERKKRENLGRNIHFRLSYRVESKKSIKLPKVKK